MTVLSAKTPFTKKKAYSLCNDLLHGFSLPEFQRKLKDLLAGRRFVTGHLPGRSELALTVHSRVLPKYGFPGTPAGVHAMFDAVFPLQENSALHQMKVLVEDKLGMNAETFLDKLLVLFESSHLQVEEGLKSLSKVLSREEVIRLTKELTEAFSTGNFQKRLQKLDVNDVAGRKKLAFTVQEILLPRFGIPGTSSGVEFMLRSIAPHLDDLTLRIEGWMMQVMLREIEFELVEEYATSVRKELPNLLQSKPEMKPESRPEIKAARGAPMQVAARLTKDQAFKMLWQLLEGYSSPVFQQQLKALERNRSSLTSKRPTRKTPNYIPGRSKLARSVQSKVLPLYGIPATCDGEKIMNEELLPFKDDWTLHVMLWAIDIQLGRSSESTIDRLLKFVRSHSDLTAQVRLTKVEVLSMTKELLQGFSNPSFQAELEEFLCNEKSAWDMPGRVELALTVQTKVLPNYGIPGTAAGVVIMLEAMLPCMDDEMQQIHAAMLGAISPFLSDWMILMDASTLKDMLWLVDNKLNAITEGNGFHQDVKSLTAVSCLDCKSHPSTFADKLSDSASESLVDFQDIGDEGMQFKRLISGNSEVSTTCSYAGDAPDLFIDP